MRLPKTGLRLPGMGAVKTGLTVTEKLEELLEFSTTSIVRVKLGTKAIDGENLGTEDIASAEGKLTTIRGLSAGGKGGMFVVFGFEDNERKCMLISFVPEGMKVKSKMLFASSKNVLKEAVQKKNPEARLEEYNVTELKEISEEVYMKKKNIEKPFSEQEKRQMEADRLMEEERKEAGDGEQFLKRIKENQANKNAYALPGFGIGMKPSEVKKNRVASMQLAKDKDAQRNERVDFLMKLKEERKKMEAEQAALLAAQEANGGGNGNSEEGEKSDGDGVSPPEVKPRLKPGLALKPGAEKRSPPPTPPKKVAEVIDLNEIEDEEDSDEN